MMGIGWLLEGQSSGSKRRSSDDRAEVLVCLLGVFMGCGTVQEQNKVESVRFDPPAAMSTVEATYPLHSVAWGTVVLEVNLDDRGGISDVRVVHGIASLTEPAVRSVRQWKFKPARSRFRQTKSAVRTGGRWRSTV
jgi:hypothetical protein